MINDEQCNVEFLDGALILFVFLKKIKNNFINFAENLL
jgi:hypothetical protein